MASLETQVGQIFINNKKLAKSFVSLFSEKIAETGAELFVLVEVSGILNPQAWQEYEKISKVLALVLKKNYRKENPSAFENSIAQINDQLADLAGQGQTTWVGKLNGCIAVRSGSSLYVASTGKVHAYLFRDKQFSDIADSNSKASPLKTFENFAVGKIAKNDYLIFTTKELFNYISIERLQKILADLPIGSACQTIAELLKELADESVSFGTFIIELGYASEFSAQEAMKALKALPAKNLSSKAGELAGSTAKVLSKLFQFTKNIKLRPAQKPKPVGSEFLAAQKAVTQNPKIKELPRAKKFFLGAAIVCAALLVVNIALAVRVHYQKKTEQDLQNKLTDIQNKINDANAAYIFKDPQRAVQSLNQAKDEFKTLPKNDPAIAQKQNAISSEINALSAKIEHVQDSSANSLLTYSASPIDTIKLLANRLYLINKAGDFFVPYDLSTKSLGQNFTLSAPPIQNIAPIPGGFAFLDKDGNIYKLNSQNQNISKQGLLAQNSIGLASYGNLQTKIYTIDPASGSITYAYASGSGQATTYYKSQSLSNALDLTIDGSIYVLTNSGIQKFLQRKPVAFSSAANQFSAGAKVYTNTNYNWLYIMDPQTKRIIILDKKTGAVINQLTSDSFGSLKDFAIDEINRTAYVLSDQTVFALHF